MAKKENGLQATVDAWAAVQGRVEKLATELQNARQEAQSYAHTLFREFGTETFSVAALGRDYRVIRKPAREGKKGIIAETFNVIPVPDFAPKHSF